MFPNHFYNKNLRQNAHELRKNSVSKAEKYLWKALRCGQQGVKFKRQRPISNFIVDFFAQEIGLIIEFDGNSHFYKASYDAYRQRKLLELNFQILRFTEGEVMHNLDEVLTRIQHAIYSLKSMD
jgi:very-short-patch-repair endonuclease